MQSMRIPTLASLISECWNRAELALQDQIKQELPDINEETITVLLSGKLRSEFNRISEKGAVACAFLRDLCLSFPCIDRADLDSKIARRLIATVHFHQKEVEKHTGGDFGIVFVRPVVRRAAYPGSKLTILDDYRQGLLCQAKIFRRDSSWAKLSANQRKVIREKLNYFALVLYRYTDQSGARCELSSIQWQVTCDAELKDVDGWLQSGSFPSPTRSQQIINQLAQGEIGTGDKNIIANYIAPPMRPAFEICVGWRDGDAPGREVQISKSTAQMQMRQLHNN
jgi:hypothetical protein